MGRSDSSKPTPNGEPQQRFGGSHVNPRDQVGSRSGIRAARPPYDSTISRGTTTVKLSVLTSSPPTGIKHPGLTGSPLPFPKRPVYRIVIPETTRGTNRPTLKTWTTEETSTHAGGLDLHRRWRTRTRTRTDRADT
ncbi:hypothetical protein BHE74_00024683 [Ensete ventricosum]|nr:hypothetical protein BHE74_00024683 [Ensete ventricosum]